MVKNQESPSGGLVASAAICPTVGGKLRAVDLLMTALTSRRGALVLCYLAAGRVSMYVTGRAACACMLAGKLEANPRMIEVHRGPVAGGVASPAAPGFHFCRETSLMPVLVTVLTCVACESEDLPPFVHPGVTLPAGRCKMSAHQGKT